MILAIDIGNSSINTGVFHDKKLLEKFKVPTIEARAAALAGRKISAFLPERYLEKPLRGIIISSVVPELTDALTKASRELGAGEPLLLTSSLDTGLCLEVQSPDEIGTDRIASAVAAKTLYGSPVIVADFGTATTVSAVADSSFIGGAILPGAGIMSYVLHEKTSKLPIADITLPEDKILHVPAVGRNTIENIISGIIYGTAGAVERIVAGMEEETGRLFTVTATGGYSGIITRFLKRKHCLDPDLTLKGLMLIYERNS